jgi:hypothetical protein
MINENAIQITLETLKIDFEMDISSTENLTGEALKAECERLEDQLFEQQMTERRALLQQHC